MYIHSNIRFLRKSKGWTQERLAIELEVKRSLIGAYEEERARPTYETLQQLSKLFKVSIDKLIGFNMQLTNRIPIFSEKQLEEMSSGKHLRVLSITVDQEQRENIEYVPVKASAGYLRGYSDPQYLHELNRFRLPFLQGGTYRAFEIKGDSMLPVLPGSILVGEYVEDWKNIKEGSTYIVVSKDEGIVYKRLFHSTEKKDSLLMRSDNPGYPPYEMHLGQVLEMWRAVLNISHLNRDSQYSYHHILSMMQEMKDELQQMKKG